MLGLALLPLFAAGQVGPLPKHPAHVALVSEARQVRPGEAFEVALRFQMMPGWHIYWENPGESGQAPTVDWHLPKDWTAGPIEWPVPKRMDTAGTVTYTYENEALLLTKISVPAGASPGSARIAATTKWLVCREGCMPDQATAVCQVSVADHVVRDTNWAPKISAATARMPAQSSNYAEKAMRHGGTIDLSILPRSAEADRNWLQGATFFPADTSVEPSAPQPATKIASGFVLQLKVSSYAPAKIDRLRGLLVNPSGPIGRVRAIAIDIPIQRTTA